MLKETNFNRRRFLRGALMTIVATQFSTNASAKTRPELFPLSAQRRGSIHHLYRARNSKEELFSSSFGRIPASIGGANFLMCAPGPKNIKTRAWL